MEAENRKRHVIAVFALLIFVIVLSCYAAGKSGKEMPDEEAAVSETETAGEEAVSDSAEAGKDSQGTEEKDF